MRFEVAEPDPNTFLLLKLEEIWRDNKILFILGMFAVVMVIVGIIIGVVTFMVTPSLPTARVSEGLLKNLRNEGSNREVASLLLRIFDK